ncbi:DNA damage-inducible protein 1-like [Nilaparvata lugens]|uniref:DNA damage-inducible protein 1-like n=1 Tax=Nilaparvata lugens TaxID=108931 RepID=UPI00193D2875|nr:DNA damage-inducible protein 1-like [Nilaparvata lugens]
MVTTDKAAVVRTRNQLQVEPESQFDNRLYTTVEVAGHQYRALLDTGAESNYLSLATFASLEAAGCARRTLTERGVILANGTAARLYGKVEINLKVGQELLPTVMTIMEGLSPEFLFGMQFLQEHRVKIDTRTCTVEWEPQPREKSAPTTQKTVRARGREMKSGAAAIDMQGKCPQPQETHVFMLVRVQDVWLNALVDIGAESSYVSGEAA